MARLLLKNGVALVHGPDDKVEPTKTDVLIEGNKISQVAPGIAESAGTEVIDCTDKIISPGFIDAHHHVWQTQLKGRHANQTLVQYMPCGNYSAKTYTASDVFWGQLGGCMEMIDGGTTTVADYAHISMSPEHNHNAISATVASGIRSTYGFAPNPRLKTISPFEIDFSGLGGHTFPTFEQLAKTGPWGNGRVTLGFAYDGFPWTPKEYLDAIMAKVAEYKISLIQVHNLWRPGRPSVPENIASQGFLDGRFLFAHSIGSKEDADLFRTKGVHYSSTPSTELQMAMGSPVGAFRDDLGIRDLGSLGVDCHSNNSAFIPGEARIGLQGARAVRGEEAAAKGKTPAQVGYTVEEAFNLATIRGAHAMKMADQIGSIAVGKLADLVVMDATSPSMVCGAQHDPVAAVILHSSPADVDTVIVDGVVRKRAGKLVSVELDETGSQVAGASALEWKDVARQLVRTRERIQGEVAKIDQLAAEKQVLQLFGMREEDLS